MTNDNYIAVTGHFLFDSKLMTCLLSFIEASASHTADDIAKYILEDFRNNYRLLKIIYCVTDNAPAMPLVAEKLNINHVPCYLHTLQLVIKHAILKSLKISNELNEDNAFEISRLAFIRLLIKLEF